MSRQLCNKCGEPFLRYQDEELCRPCWSADRIAELEAQLEAVRKLLPRWREGDFDLPPYVRGKMDGCHECADELEAILGKEPDLFYKGVKVVLSPQLDDHGK